MNWPCCGGESEHRYNYHIPDPKKVKDAKALGIYFKGTITDIEKKPDLAKIRKSFPNARQFFADHLTDPYVCLNPKEEQTQLQSKDVAHAMPKLIQQNQVTMSTRTHENKTEVLALTQKPHSVMKNVSEGFNLLNWASENTRELK